MKQFLFIFLGGGAGSVLRWATQQLLKDWFPTILPIPLLFINLLGCFFIGFFSALLLDTRILNHELIKYLLIIGLCGGYTTFSSFSLDNYQMLVDGKFMPLLMNTVLSVVLGIFLVFIGFKSYHYLNH